MPPPRAYPQLRCWSIGVHSCPVVRPPASEGRTLASTRRRATRSGPASRRPRPARMPPEPCGFRSRRRTGGRAGRLSVHAPRSTQNTAEARSASRVLCSLAKEPVPPPAGSRAAQPRRRRGGGPATALSYENRSSSVKRNPNGFLTSVQAMASGPRGGGFPRARPSEGPLRRSRPPRRRPPGRRASAPRPLRRGRGPRPLPRA
jgi:hypothetical protein